ncbi:MAG: FAD-binding protein [Ilumatobacteraceae bacterium]
MDLTAFAEQVGAVDPVSITGAGTRGGAVPGVRRVHPPSGIDWIEADEMTARCGAGTPVDDLAAALAAVGQRTVLPPGGTVGGALSLGHSSVRRLGDGPVRDCLLQACYVGADGAIVQAGGPTVKNVSGFDVCRLLVGARGTIGFIGDVIVRTRPIALHSQWYSAAASDPLPVFVALHRPTSVLWDGFTVWVLLEGHPSDVAESVIRVGLTPCGGPPVLPPERCLVPPIEQTALVSRLGAGSFVVELGVGVVHAQPGLIDPMASDPASRAVSARVKQQFDPTGRLNPGVVVG